MYGLSLQWKRCPDGVELFDYGREPGKTIAATPKSGLWYRFRSARRDPVRYDISALEDPIIARYLNAKDDEGRAAFFSRFGLLDDPATSSGELLKDEAEAWQARLASLLASAGSGRSMTAINAVNRALSAHVTFAPIPVLDLPGNAKLPRLALHPRSLFSLMLMEAAMVAVNGARRATCDHCGNVFLTGPLTGRRSTARFCSDRHRVAAMRKRKAASK